MCSFFRPDSSPSEAELDDLRTKVKSLESELAVTQQHLLQIQEQNSTLKEENERIKKDQEDLLVLLADQDGQVEKYKDRLKSLGQTVSLSLSIHLK